MLESWKQWHQLLHHLLVNMKKVGRILLSSKKKKNWNSSLCIEKPLSLTVGAAMEIQQFGSSFFYNSFSISWSAAIHPAPQHKVLDSVSRFIFLVYSCFFRCFIYFPLLLRGCTLKHFSSYSSLNEKFFFFFNQMSNIIIKLSTSQ